MIREEFSVAIVTNVGHFAYECKSGKGGRRKPYDEAYHARDDRSDSDQVLLIVTTNSDTVENSESWYLDTGCSNHMTGHIWLLDF